MEKVENRIRLNRYLAQCGLGSRREADRLIAAGSITINGVIQKELGVKVDPSRDVITVRGKRIGRVLPLEYIACHKSKGVLVTASDPEGRLTIYDALRKAGLDATHLKYVGRLDRNSEGLLLLTNDGELVHALTHPRFEIKKVYQVRTNHPLSDAHVAQMTREGIQSEGQTLRAGAIRPRPHENAPDEFWYEIDLYEGKNRQIRRMFEALGFEIIRLKRTQYGVIKIGSLPRGGWRRLGEREVMGLKNLGHGETAKRKAVGPKAAKGPRT